MNRILLPIFIISFGLLAITCQKENISYDSSHKLGFSLDTLAFDTVFTTIGSSTRSFRIYNPNRQSVIINSVTLAGGEKSFFRMNVDGEPTRNARNIEIRGGDSLFVFVEVTIDPTNQNNPLLIADSIVFNTNGNVQDVKLVAWGQDVHLHSSKEITGTYTLTADKPHLIYNHIFVEEDAKLIIEAGARLHFHYMSFLGVLGTLEIRGEPDNPVIIEADRLEEFYRDKAGQWYGIILADGSHSNIIQWAEIKNAVIGVMVNHYVDPNEPTLIIENSRIENMSGAALHGRGAYIRASNSLFANAAQVVLSLKYGGRYQFYHCTVANYWGYYMNRQGPSIVLNNFYAYKEKENDPTTTIDTYDLEEAYFGNCIIYGTMSDELDINNVYGDSVVDAKMNYLFENCILRATDEKVDLTDEKHFRNVINKDPLFIDPKKYNYLLDSLSPARGIGLPSITQQYPLDLNNNSRLEFELPDLGAYQWTEAADETIEFRRGR